jgi:anti-sigma factor RsiW
MTSPNPIDPAMSRWLDGAASPEEARLVESRLAADPRLAAEVERLRADLDLFRADVRPRGASLAVATLAVATLADGDMVERVLAAVAAGEPGPTDEERFRRVARRWSAAAAVLVAVGVGGSVAVDRIAPPAEAGDSAALTSFVEINRFSLEVDLALDQRQVSPPVAPSLPPAPSAPSDARPR